MLELRVEVSSLAESVAGPVEEVGPTIQEIDDRIDDPARGR